MNLPGDDFPKNPEQGSQPVGAQETSGAGLKQAAEQKKASFSREAKHWKEDAKQFGREMTDEAKKEATHQREYWQERGSDYLNEKKGRVAEQMRGYGSVAHRAAEQFREEQDVHLAEYADSLASCLDKASSYVEERDLSSLKHDAEDLARQRPELWFGGMFVAGLALARFLKAGQKPRSQRQYESEWQDDWDEDYGLYPLPEEGEPEMAAKPEASTQPGAWQPGTGPGGAGNSEGNKLK